MANNSFKDRRSLREHRPDFFTPGSATELVLLEDTDLEVIFLNEGAGWTNSFGYYTYDPLNPPQTPGELRSKTILFPNVSKGRNSGLVRGDKICLTRLKAGTVVGFFLNARGWKKKQLTKGMFTNYSNPLFNTHWNKGEQQASVLLDAGHDHYLLLSFEDHRPPRSDMDFEDASFLLLPSNPNSIDYSQLADLE
jgi:hypothetical protein